MAFRLPVPTRSIPACPCFLLALDPTPMGRAVAMGKAHDKIWCATELVPRTLPDERVPDVELDVPEPLVHFFLLALAGDGVGAYAHFFQFID